MQYIKITKKELFSLILSLLISIIISSLVGLVDMKAVAFYIIFFVIYVFLINTYRLIKDFK